MKLAVVVALALACALHTAATATEHPPQCTVCRDDTQCAAPLRCTGHRCSIEGRPACPGLPPCAPCAADYDCAVGLCLGDRCSTSHGSACPPSSHTHAHLAARFDTTDEYLQLHPDSHPQVNQDRSGHAYTVYGSSSSDDDHEDAGAEGAGAEYLDGHYGEVNYDEYGQFDNFGQDEATLVTTHRSLTAPMQQQGNGDKNEGGWDGPEGVVLGKPNGAGSQWDCGEGIGIGETTDTSTQSEAVNTMQADERWDAADTEYGAHEKADLDLFKAISSEFGLDEHNNAVVRELDIDDLSVRGASAIVDETADHAPGDDMRCSADEPHHC